MMKTCRSTDSPTAAAAAHSELTDNTAIDSTGAAAGPGASTEHI